MKGDSWMKSALYTLNTKNITPMGKMFFFDSGFLF